MGLGDIAPPSPYGQNAQGPSYNQAFLSTGLGSLAQGFAQGIGSAQQMAMQQKMLENEAAYRNSMLGVRSESEKERASLDAEKIKAMEAKLNQNFAPAGQPIQIPDGKGGNLLGVTDGKGGIKIVPPGKGAKTDEKALNSAAGAYKAMDDYTGIADTFLPESSLGAAAKAPWEMLRSAVSQTSPENNLKDKSGQAATFYAAAVNASGGGRMSEAEIQNMAHSMGGRGIGESKPNLHNKVSQMKDELALKTGLTRSQIEDYMTKQSGGGPKVGHIEDGHEYLGGDPSNPASWKKVK